MIAALLRRARAAYWRDPYFPRVEPPPDLPQLRDRIAQARAQVRDMKAALDMNSEIQ